jgi:hypothetical protein
MTAATIYLFQPGRGRLLPPSSYSHGMPKGTGSLFPTRPAQARRVFSLVIDMATFKRFRGLAGKARYEPHSHAEWLEERELMRQSEVERLARHGRSVSPEEIRQSLCTPTNPIGSADTI